LLPIIGFWIRRLDYGKLNQTGTKVLDMAEDSSNNQETFDERLNRQTKPPCGQRLNLHSLRFAEVIKISEADNLKSGLDRLYEEVIPVKNATKYISDQQDNYRNFIVRARKAFLSGGYVRISLKSAACSG
jgi:hypothetical protein